MDTMATNANRTEDLAHEVTTEILGMGDTEALATIEHLQHTLDELTRVFLHPTNIEPLFS
jgi:hypothetical protein